MTSSTLVTDYLGNGVAASRPATPPVPSGSLAFYYATDTGALSLYVPGTGWINLPASTMLDALFGNTRGSIIYRGASAWTALAPGTSSFVLTSNGAGADPSWAAGGGGGGYPPGTLPTKVQFAHSVSGGNSVTFGSAPTNGNLLVAHCFNPTSDTAGSGWTIQTLNGSGTDYGIILTKVAGASESTTQTPLSGVSTTGCIAIWEINGQHATNYFAFGQSQAEQGPATSNTPVVYPNLLNCIGLSAVGIVSGVTINSALNVGTQDVLDNTGSRALVAGHSDLSQSPMVGILTVLSGSGSSKGTTCMITS